MVVLSLLQSKFASFHVTFTILCQYAIQNSTRIPKECQKIIQVQFPNNSQTIPKKFSKNFQKISKQFPKNSKRILKNSQKVLTRPYRSKSFSSLLYLTLRIEFCSHFEQNSERKNISLTMNRLDQK